MHPGFKWGPFLPHNLIPLQWSPVSFLKFQMAPRLKLLIYFGSKKKEPRYTYLSAAKAAAHLLHKGLLVSHNKWRCLLRVLCPVKTNNNTGLCPIKGQKSGICSWPEWWVVNLTPWPLYTWERTLVPIDIF